MKLRMRRPDPAFHMVLVEPEIPQNTGNIARLCAATGAHLHLVGQLGFRVDEHAVRRAGLDYWHLVTVEQHPDLDTCLSRIAGPPPILFTSAGAASYLDAPWVPGAALVFGKETKGLDAALTARYPGRLFAIPTVEGSVRSLNLANAASIALYEALRATGSLRAVERA